MEMLVLTSSARLRRVPIQRSPGKCIFSGFRLRKTQENLEAYLRCQNRRRRRTNVKTETAGVASVNLVEDQGRRLSALLVLCDGGIHRRGLGHQVTRVLIHRKF